MRTVEQEAAWERLAEMRRKLDAARKRYDALCDDAFVGIGAALVTAWDCETVAVREHQVAFAEFRALVAAPPAPEGTDGK